MTNQGILWMIFSAIVVIVLTLDLGVFHRKSRIVNFKDAALWSVVWILLALGFMGLVRHVRGPQSALEFLTGYLIEESLSVDNLFVFLLLFSYFAVPQSYQHNVLFLGILGAMVLRAVFIVAGVALLQNFHWIIYVFGAVLIVSGAKMAFEKDKKIHPEKNPVLKLFRRFVPVTEQLEGNHLFVRREKRLFATPLLVVLLVVETTNLIFAVDSIPAVMAVTRDPFIIYTSNVFAIIGLRSLYFALAGAMDLFHRLHYGLSAILIFVGVKMLLEYFLEIPIGIMLGVIAVLLLFSVIASWLWPQKTGPASALTK